MALQPGGSFLTKVKTMSRSLLEKAFEIIENEQRARAAQSIEEQARALIFCGFSDIGVTQFASKLVEQLGEAADEKATQIAYAIVVEFTRLKRDEHDLLKGVGWCIVGGANGERGFAHAAWSIDEGAPGAALRIESVGDLLQLFLTPEEGLERREDCAGLRCVSVSSIGIVPPSQRTIFLKSRSA